MGSACKLGIVTWTDAMLYKKYGITSDEITTFINSMIRPMGEADE
jgi:hypothetical protein